MQDVFQAVSQDIIQTSQRENILEDKAFFSMQGEYKLPLGKAEDGTLIVKDLEDITHILVGGTTSSGKTSFVQTTLSVLCKNSNPNEFKVLVYDSKAIDYSAFKSIPHLIKPVMFERNSAINSLRWIETEEKERLNRFVDVCAKDLDGYNNRCNNAGLSKIPRILVVLDDFSMLMLEKDEMNVLLNIIKNGRTTGIHFIIVSSLLSKAVLPKELLSIIPCRISFRLTSRDESSNFLGITGAESLNPPEDMIFRFLNESIRCKAAHATFENISNVMKSLKNQTNNMGELREKAAQLFSNQNPHARIKQKSGTPGSYIIKGQKSYNFYENSEQREAIEHNDFKYDELIADVGRFVIDNQKGSIGMLQRTFKIGFNRAAVIMDQLEELGVVGIETGTKPRSILMSLDEWESIVANNFKRGDKLGTFPKVETDKHEKESKEIQLRDFETISVGTTELCIKNNKIKYVKQVMFAAGSGHITPEFGGDIIRKIIYKPPTLFSKGYFTFGFDENQGVTVQNENPDKVNVNANSQNISEIIKVSFDSSKDRDIKRFLQQISEDIGIPITRK